MPSQRIVWNLTKKCPECCSFCAAAACRNAPDDPLLKSQILEGLLSSGIPLEIDFSGGNPWSGEGSLAVITRASEILGRDRITISGLGISLVGGG